METKKPRPNYAEPAIETVTDETPTRERGSLTKLLLGRLLHSDEDVQQRVGVASGIPIFGLDALGSAAYGPEAALTVLLPLGAAGVFYIGPITILIVVLLTLVYWSYRQTIEAYPAGGGSYTVARRNLGPSFGLLAGAALTLDYLMNVAVGISTGVGALVSAVPSLEPHTLMLCLGILLIITLINLRGVRETGLAFLAPTYVFVACMLLTLVLGLFRTILGGGHPTPVVAPPVPQTAGAVSAWLLVRAFASGCTAMTGVEAVSNGVQAFREPVVQTARRTLTLIILLLMIMLCGIAYLVRVYKIGATQPGQAHYESILSQLIGAIAGKGAFYYVSIASVLVVLSLSANTSFADFPRLCRAMAQDGFLPYEFASRGRRLVYSYGVYSLTFLSAVLLIVFGGVTDRLIPLFAVGAFLSFTLSQVGMVGHWRAHPGPRSRLAIWINGVGASATGLTLLVVIAAKFLEGAWVTVLLVAGLVSLMASIRRHYHRVTREVSSPSPIDLHDLKPPIAVVPIQEWNNVAKRALRYALSISEEIRAVHVSSEKPDFLEQQWQEWFVEPVRERGIPIPRLIVISSPYRLVVGPIVRFIEELERENPDREIVVVVSELVVRRWYHFLLHNQRGEVLTAMLTLGDLKKTAVVNVPWHLNA